jgi:hypothetical protein
MKAECFKMLDDRPQTKSATLMIEFGMTKGTADCYRSYHKRLREERERQKEAKRQRRH